MTIWNAIVQASNGDHVLMFLLMLFFLLAIYGIFAVLRESGIFGLMDHIEWALRAKMQFRTFFGKYPFKSGRRTCTVQELEEMITEEYVQVLKELYKEKDLLSKMNMGLPERQTRRLETIKDLFYESIKLARFFGYKVKKTYKEYIS